MLLSEQKGFVLSKNNILLEWIYQASIEISCIVGLSQLQLYDFILPFTFYTLTKFSDVLERVIERAKLCLI